MNLETLAKRARLQNLTSRAKLLEDIHAMLDGSYIPPNGAFTPQFAIGSDRHAAFLRAARKTSTAVPLVISKSLAGLDFGNVTWSDAETQKDAVDDVLHNLRLGDLARDVARQYKMSGATAILASTPLDTEGRATEPVLEILTGMNIPYTDPKAPGRVNGWYRAIQYLDETYQGKLRWWVEAYEFLSDGSTRITVWRSLGDPTQLGMNPDDQFVTAARPRFAVYGLQDDLLPTSPVLTNLGRVFGLYATELTLATSEELAGWPMLFLKGNIDLEETEFGPAQPIVADENGDARWLDPGKLDELREQIKLKRDLLREVFNLPGGSLGSQTPSGEALAEANRGFMQETRALGDIVSRVLTEGANDYLRLLELPEVTVSVPIDRAYLASTQLEMVEKGTDLGAIPTPVVARWFQQSLGSTAYSDDELAEFIASLASRRLGSPPGTLVE